MFQNLRTPVRSASFSFVCFFNQLLKQNTPDVTLKKCSVLVGDQGKIASTFEFTWQYGHEIEFARAAAWLKRHWLHTILSQHHVMLLQKLHIQPKTLPLLYFKVHLKTQQKALLFLKSTLNFVNRISVLDNIQIVRNSNWLACHICKE